MEIKDNELIVTFLEEDNFVNTFTFFAEEDSGEFLTDIYHDFMKWCCGLDEDTESIFNNSNLWSVVKKEGEFSTKLHGVEFSGTVGYTNVLGYSPFTHVGRLSGGLNIKFYDQFLDDIVTSERTFRMMVAYPHNLDHKLYDGKKGI